MEIEALIFDVDGLLADTEVYYTKSWQQALAKLGIQISDKQMLSFRGYNWKIVRQKLIKDYGEKLADQAVILREEILLEHIECGDIQAKPYATEILNWAKEAGYRLAIASAGKKARAKRIVESLGLMPYFEHMTFGDDVPVEKNKPEPGPYLRALAALQVETNQAIAIEDSIVGATSATRAGLAVIFIPDQSIEGSNQDTIPNDLNIVITGRDLRIVKQYLTEKITRI